MTPRVRSRAVWIAFAVAILAVIGGVVGFAGWTLSPGSLKPRLIEAARRATGREVTIAGDVGIRLALSPTVTMEDVTLANPPGFSRPDMVKVARVELRVALWPLLRHRVEIDHVTLVRPEAVLETDANGRANWVFARRRPPVEVKTAAPVEALPQVRADNPPKQPATASVPSSAPTPRRVAVAFKGVDVIDGRFGWIDGRSRHEYFGEIPRLTIDASRVGSGQLTGSVLFGGRTIGLTARAEPGEGALPVSLRLETGGASLTAEGRIADPAHGRGYAIALHADVPDPSVLAPFFPRLPLAALHGVSAQAEVADSGGPIPTLSALMIKVGSVDAELLSSGFAAGLPGLGHDARLSDVTLSARGAEPIKVAAKLALSGVDSTIGGTFGDLPWLASGASASVTGVLTWNAGSAEAAAQGMMQRPRSLSGVVVDVAVNLPDPAVVVRDAPAALKDVVFRARLSDAGGPTPFQLTSSAGDLAGQLTVSRSPRLSIEGQVWSRFLDIDLLRGVPPAAPMAGQATAAREEGGPATGAPTGAGQGTAEPPPAPSGSGPTPRAGAMAEPTPAIAAKPRAAPVATTGPLIPDTKLPFDMIRAVDGNVTFTLGELHVEGASVRKIDGVVAAKDGRLRLEPFSIAALSQRLNGILVVDASKSPVSVHTEFTAPGIALFPLLATLGLPRLATGHVAVQADLTGVGDTPRALAASVSGWAGMAVEDGQLDARLVTSWLGQAQPFHIGGPPVADVKCFAVRGDAKDGVLTLQPMALDTAALIIEGNGDVDLRRETLSLRLRPRARIGGTGIALPVRVSGPLRDPGVKIDISSKGMGGGAMAGLLLGGGKDIMGAAGGGDPCPQALARARGGASGEGAPK